MTEQKIAKAYDAFTAAAEHEGFSFDPSKVVEGDKIPVALLTKDAIQSLSISADDYEAKIAPFLSEAKSGIIRKSDFTTSEQNWQRLLKYATMVSVASNAELVKIVDGDINTKPAGTLPDWVTQKPVTASPAGGATTPGAGTTPDSGQGEAAQTITLPIGYVQLSAPITLKDADGQDQQVEQIPINGVVGLIDSNDDQNPDNAIITSVGLPTWVPSDLSKVDQEAIAAKVDMLQRSLAAQNVFPQETDSGIYSLTNNPADGAKTLASLTPPPPENNIAHGALSIGGAVIGTALGAWAGAAGAAFTLGASVPVCMAVGGALGSMIGETIYQAIYKPEFNIIHIAISGIAGGLGIYIAAVAAPAAGTTGLMASILATSGRRLAAQTVIGAATSVGLMSTDGQEHSQEEYLMGAVTAAGTAFGLGQVGNRLLPWLGSRGTALWRTIANEGTTYADNLAGIRPQFNATASAGTAAKNAARVRMVDTDGVVHEVLEDQVAAHLSAGYKRAAPLAAGGADDAAAAAAAARARAAAAGSTPQAALLPPDPSVQVGHVLRGADGRIVGTVTGRHPQTNQLLLRMEPDAVLPEEGVQLRFTPAPASFNPTPVAGRPAMAVGDVIKAPDGRVIGHMVDNGSGGVIPQFTAGEAPASLAGHTVARQGANLATLSDNFAFRPVTGASTPLAAGQEIVGADGRIIGELIDNAGILTPQFDRGFGPTNLPGSYISQHRTVIARWTNELRVNTISGAPTLADGALVVNRLGAQVGTYNASGITWSGTAPDSFVGLFIKMADDILANLS